MAPDPDDLDELRARLRETAEAAERIAGRVPPQGWATAGERDATASEVQALVTLLHTLRDLVPDELWEQVRELLRQLLLLLRAILDLVVERLGPEDAARGGGARRGPEVQDIPIA
jgi:fermentation-respiration switch protein FrsA (DUF1100 family)